MKSIIIIWLVFTFIFFALGYLHWEQSKQVIQKIDVTKLLGDGVTIDIKGVSLEKPFEDFADKFNNSYLDQLNKSNSKANHYAAYGYWTASLTSLFSSCLAWESYSKKKKNKGEK